MKFLRQLFLILALFSCCGLCFGAEKPSATPASPKLTSQNPVSSTAVLPAEFAGWQLKGAVSNSNDPAVADETNAPVLKEYGFLRLEKAAYARDDGRNLPIKAAVFEDASGAYGAFTYYFSPEMGMETIGAQAAFLSNRVLFYQGNVLVDAVFDKMSVMSAGQLRQLAGLLPQVGGNKGNPPSLPSRLPQRAGATSVEKNKNKYILGPAALDRVGSPLPDALVDFKSGAEVVVSQYAASAGDATLMLIEYR